MNFLYLVVRPKISSDFERDNLAVIHFPLVYICKTATSNKRGTRLLHIVRVYY